jgi:Glyoxalase/Bleomycin resistance protein/Dioxygenase superfamily
LSSILRFRNKIGTKNLDACRYTLVATWRRAESLMPAIEERMGVKATYSTPMLHVMEIERSLDFYELLGFVTVDTDGGKPLGWARMHCEGGALMFVRAEHAADPRAQGILLYMYAPDLTTLHADLQASGVSVPPIGYPEYMPSGEMRLVDPDGYSVIVAHWGKSEQQAWENRITAQSPRRGTAE